MINNRQAGRRRGRGGQRPQGGNPGRGAENGNRIDNRARGNAAQLLEKYRTLARDSQMQGDRVNTEYYLQFADHYFRVLAETRSRFEENQQPRRGRDDQFDGDGDEDFDGDADSADDGGLNFLHDRGQDTRGQDNRDNGNRDNGNRDNGNRDNARASNRDGSRDGNRPPRDAMNGNRAVPPREDRQMRPIYDAAVPADGANGAVSDSGKAHANERANERAGAAADEAPARARRGRPRREASPAPDEGRDGDMILLDADRLPPSLGISAVPSDGEPAEKPRRRRKALATEPSTTESSSAS